LAGTPRVYQSTVNRDEVKRGLEAAQEAGVELPGDLDQDFNDFGSPEELVTTAVDVAAYVDRKRAAMEAHASQIPPESFFLSMPRELFDQAFGTEWYIRQGERPAELETWLFDGLDGE